MTDGASAIEASEPSVLAETLASGASATTAHLALRLPPELMRYPWELMQLTTPDAGSELELLAMRYAVGRQMWTDREVRRSRPRNVIRMLIVAAPKTKLGARLPGAIAEGEALVKLCEQLTNELGGAVDFVAEHSIDEALTRTVLRQRLRNGNYDVIHFAGHGEFDAQAPEHSGWVLSDGKLSARELTNTLESCASPPWLIYANACSVGMIAPQTSTQYHGDVYGMAGDCIRTGVGAFVAPLWRINDISARMVAQEFCRCLLLERTTIGVALQKARIEASRAWGKRRGDRGLGDLSWAGMVLYGNPVTRLRDDNYD